MKKMTKLLSVILAFVMALSCMTMMASAAKATYQTVDDLNGKNAYSPYGTVTRLESEVRISILLDSLDNLLAPMSGLNMGQLFNILGLKLTINLTSVDNICATLDNVKSLLSNLLVRIVKGMLGIIADVDMSTWQSGMTRDNTAQLKIVAELLELLSNNTDLVNTIFTSGIKLGVANSALPDLSAINNFVTNIPSGIKGIVYPMFGREDDTKTERDKYTKKDNDLITLANDFVYGLFTKPMNWTSYRVDASGKDLGYTLALPTTNASSRYFVISEDGKYITQYDYQYPGALGDPVGGDWVETVTYEKGKEFNSEDCDTYVFRAPDWYEGDQTLKWYKADGKVDAEGNIQSSYWLPSVKEAFESGKLSININSESDSLASLLYSFIPYIFAEMAPTILNGSAKKLIAEAFDVEFEKIGVKGSDEVAAVASATGDPDSFFTKDQEYYVWEYTAYKVIDDVPYYRYQDTFFKGTLPSNISAYYAMFNWDWEITDDFVNEFIPTSVGSGYLVDNINNLFAKAIDEMINESWEYKDKTYNRADIIKWEKGGNEKLLNNILNTAREFFKIAPEDILDEYYMDAQFAKVMMETGTLQQSVNALVCEVVKLIMPQIKFSDDIVNQPITAIAAVVVRELCTQLIPTYNFDAMIYANYGGTSNATRTLLTHSADEWLDITLYMGVNLGMYYIRNIADVGEDSNLGYYNVMKSLGALPTANGDKQTFTATSYKANGGIPSWLVAVDWIVDWALSTETLWCWSFGNFVNVDGTVALATYENPFNKINSVILTLIPDLENLLDTSSLNGSTYGSNTFIEKVLKGGLVDSIVNLDVAQITNILHVPVNSVLRSGNIADTLVNIIVKLLNGIFHKLAGNKNLVASGITSVNTLLNQNNLKGTVVNLVGALYTAYNNGLLDTVLPLANFFIGWTTDAQKYAEPTMYFENGDGVNYFYTGATETLTVINSSSGMLLKHRNSSIVDTAYAIKLNGITSSDGTITVDTTDTLGPGEKKTYTLTTTDATTERAVRLSVKYSFTGKDGAALGGQQIANTMTYVSNMQEQARNRNQSVNVQKKNLFNTVIVNSDLMGPNGVYINSRDDLQSKIADLTFTASNNIDDTAYTLRNLSFTGFDSTYITNSGEIAALSGKSMAASSSLEATFGTMSDDVAKSIASGSYTSLGSVSVTIYNSSSKSQAGSISFGNFFFADAKKLDDLFESENKLGRIESRYTADSWAPYDAAMKAAAAISVGPRNTATFATRFSQSEIDRIYKALSDAIKGLKATTTVDVNNVIAKLDEIENDKDGRDLDFQDYALFEYFNYEEQRTSAREMIKATVGPTEPEKYIDSVWGDDLVDAIIAAQTKESLKKGITATVVEPTDEEMEAFYAANADFVPASYTDLQVEDQVAKLQYYYNFMKANARTEIDKTFLNKEIAYAEAQGYEQAKYSVDSWSRYTEALANAKKIAADAKSLQSRVFDAKYELMVAQNALLEKSKSMKDNVEVEDGQLGYLDHELNELIRVANAIIEYYGTYYTVNPSAGVTDDEALAALVRALGIEYSVSVDGETYEGILYNRSAITFQQYDRLNTVKNKRAVDAAADKLRAAIAYFKCDAQVVENDPEISIVTDHDVLLVVGFQPNAITEEKDIFDRVDFIAPLDGNYSLDVSTSKAGFYGTGTCLKITDESGTPLVSYFIVIYGDVNGDGAIDAFDALEVDHAYHDGTYYMGNIYDDAADVNHDGVIDSADYAALVESVNGTTPIGQTVTTPAE